MKKDKEKIKEELDYLLTQEQTGYLAVPQGFKVSGICSVGDVAYHFSKKRELEDKIKELKKKILPQQERERQYELLMSCLPEDAENLSTLTDNQAGRLIRCFLKKKPWK